mgnify:CR=1 FL=1
MIGRRYLGTSLLALAVVLIATAPALATNARKLTLHHDMVLKGTQLQAGEYVIGWESSSATATVTVSKEKVILATVEGELVERGTKYRRNAVMYDGAADGTRIIREIRFAGSSQVIVFAE